jgi:hypothetical protein
MLQTEAEGTTERIKHSYYFADLQKVSALYLRIAVNKFQLSFESFIQSLSCLLYSFHACTEEPNRITVVRACIVPDISLRFMTNYSSLHVQLCD